MADGSATGVHANHMLNQLGFRRVGLTAATESNDTIAVTCQFEDIGGNAVSSAARACAMILGEPAGDYTIAESGDGEEVSVTGHTAITFTFASDGDATVTVTDVSGASGEVITLLVWPLDVPCLMSTVDLTFD